MIICRDSQEKLHFSAEKLIFSGKKPSTAEQQVYFSKGWNFPCSRVKSGINMEIPNPWFSCLWLGDICCRGESEEMSEPEDTRWHLDTQHYWASPPSSGPWSNNPFSWVGRGLWRQASTSYNRSSWQLFLEWATTPFFVLGYSFTEEGTVHVYFLTVNCTCHILCNECTSCRVR